jgi:hypothetical protein
VIPLAVSIRYWEKESWVNYFKNDVLPLYSSAITITSLWKELKEKVHGRLLSEVIKERSSLEQAFVGGTSPPDKYEENGLAWIYKKLLGASVNLRDYYFLKKLGKEPKTLCNVESTNVVNYVAHIAVLLERALTRVCDLDLLAKSSLQDALESSRKGVDEVLREPVRVSEKFVDFLNKALRVTVAYNEYTRFIWFLRKIAKKYIKEFYPELLKPEVFEFIKNLLGLREYIVPQVDDPEIVDLYTIFSFDYATKIEGIGSTAPRNKWIDGMCVADLGYLDKCFEEYFRGRLPEEYEPYKTIGGCMCRVNELIWGLFYWCSNELKLIVSDELPDPFLEWRKIVGTLGHFSFSPLPSLKSYEALSRLDESLPGVLVGRFELVEGVERGRELHIITRW